MPTRGRRLQLAAAGHIARNWNTYAPYIPTAYAAWQTYQRTGTNQSRRTYIKAAAATAAYAMGRKRAPSRASAPSAYQPTKRRRTTARVAYSKKRRTTYRRRRKAKRTAMRLPRIGFVNTCYKCRLVAHNDFDLTSGAGGLANVQRIAWNAPQDIGCVGRQPRQWDVLSNHYGRCCVIGAKVTVSNEITQYDAIKWGIHVPRRHNTADTDYPKDIALNDICEDKYIGSIANAGYEGHLGGGRTLTKKMSTRKYFSAKGDMMDKAFHGETSMLDTKDDDFWCFCNATPGSGLDPKCIGYLNVWLAHKNTQRSLNFHVKIEYICIFFRPVVTALPSN